MNTSKNWRNVMHDLRVRLSHSIAFRMFGSSSKQTKSKTLFPRNIYHRCNELPFNIFISCVCDKEYSLLVKHGKASKADIARAWESIYSEYSDISGNQTSNYLINLSKDIAYHDAKLRAVALCLKVLQHHPDQRCIKVLRDYGYEYAFDITNPSQYAKDLETVATRSGNIVMILSLKKAEYEREAAKVTGKPMTKDSFFDIMAVLAEHYHLTIGDISRDTVTAFVSYRKRYEMEMIAIKRNEEKNRTFTPNLRNIG